MNASKVATCYNPLLAVNGPLVRWYAIKILITQLTLNMQSVGLQELDYIYEWWWSCPYCHKEQSSYRQMLFLDNITNDMNFSGVFLLFGIMSCLSCDVLFTVEYSWQLLQLQWNLLLTVNNEWNRREHKGYKGRLAVEARYAAVFIIFEMYLY